MWPSQQGGGDGTSTFADARLSDSYQVSWQVEVPGTGNAGARGICSAPPTSHGVFCVDVAARTVKWSGENGYVATLPVGEQEAATAKLASADEASTRWPSCAARSVSSRGTRASPTQERRSSPAVPHPDRDGAHKALLEEVAPLRTPPLDGPIGYASPSPVTDGTSLYVAYGHGVVAKWRADGERVWATWLGPPTERMRGYDFGQTASPLLVGDVLVVPHGKLRGLDVATGEVRWTSETYSDYGTPAIVQVGDQAAVVTPDGLLVDVADGAVLQRGLGDIWYTGPVVDGADVLFLGARADAHARGSNGLDASAWRVSVGPDGKLRAEQRWSRSLPFSQRVYAAPVRVGKHWVTGGRDRMLVVIDDASGELVSQLDLGQRVVGELWTNPVASGERVLFTTDRGELVTTRIDGTIEVLGVTKVPSLRATPWPKGASLWIRTQGHLIELAPWALAVAAHLPPQRPWLHQRERHEFTLARRHPCTREGRVIGGLPRRAPWR